MKNNSSETKEAVMCHGVSGSPEGGWVLSPAAVRSGLRRSRGVCCLSKWAKTGWLRGDGQGARRGKCFVTVSDNCAHPFLILYQRLTSGSFSKVNCNVEFEAIVN